MLTENFSFRNYFRGNLKIKNMEKCNIDKYACQKIFFSCKNLEKLAENISLRCAIAETGLILFLVCLVCLVETMRLLAFLCNLKQFKKRNVAPLHSS